MGTGSVSPTANDIQWTPDSVPRLDTIPHSGIYLTQLSREDLLAYILDLREEAAALRQTMHAAIAMVARLTTQLKRSHDTIVRLHDQAREDRRAA
jgi:hypothetical protein